MESTKQMLNITQAWPHGRARDLRCAVVRSAVVINSAAVKAVVFAQRPAIAPTMTANVMGGVSFRGTGLDIAGEPVLGGTSHPTHDSTKYDTRTGTDWSPPV